MGLSVAVWAAVAFHPTALAREEVRLPEPDPSAIPAEGPLADAFHTVEGRLRQQAPSMDEATRRQLAKVIVKEADAARLDPLLVLAVIQVESSFQPQALSDAGAKGLMQLLDMTLRAQMARSGIEGDPDDPIVNVRAGVRYLRRLLDTFHSEDDALMAYNAGPVRILNYLRAGGIPDRFRVYPRRVKAVQRRLHREAALARSAVAAAEPGRAGATAMAE